MRNCANISLQWRREKLSSREGKEDEGGWEREKTRKRSVLILIFFLHLRFTSCYIIIIIILHIFSGNQTTRLLDHSRSGKRENFEKRPRYLNWISISKRSSRRFVVLSRTIYLPTVAITILTIIITYVGGVEEQSFWIKVHRRLRHKGTLNIVLQNENILHFVGKLKKRKFPWTFEWIR